MQAWEWYYDGWWFVCCSKVVWNKTRFSEMHFVAQATSSWSSTVFVEWNSNASININDIACNKGENKLQVYRCLPDMVKFKFSFSFFLRHWLQFWQLRTWIQDNLCYLTINCDTGQHSQFLRCFVNKYSLEDVDFLLILEALDLLLVSVKGSILPPVGLHRRSKIHYENKRVQRRIKRNKEGWVLGIMV